ncbi:hypothetical protein WKK05_40845 (plasmid) [Nostoc sp. UHCC 0302]|uniref:hypothetical protein n=1 Tax=Nostoc sp. UHCC 0302 TaxID=3134896 RepID=UPI00311CA4DD
MIIKTTKWTEEELTILEAKAELYTPKQIASILKRHGYFRTPDAISTKLWNLGYSTRPFLDNYSAAEIARILCVHPTTVSGWVRRGWLSTVGILLDIIRFVNGILKGFLTIHHSILKSALPKSTQKPLTTC